MKNKRKEYIRSILTEESDRIKNSINDSLRFELSLYVDDTIHDLDDLVVNVNNIYNPLIDNLVLLHSQIEELEDNVS